MSKTFQYVHSPPWLGQQFFGQFEVNMNAAGLKSGWVGYIPQDGTLEAVAFGTGSVSGSGTINLEIEGVNSSNGFPDGVTFASGSLAYTTNENQTVASIDLDTPTAVTAPQRLAIYVEQTGAGTFNVNGWNFQSTRGGYTVRDTTGSAWAFGVRGPGLSVKIDGEWMNFGGCEPPAPQNLVGTNFFDSSTFNEYGIQFQASGNVVINQIGAYFQNQNDPDATFTLYDSNSNVLASQKSNFAEQHSTSSGAGFYGIAPTELTEGEIYYIGLKPSATASGIFRWQEHRFQDAGLVATIAEGVQQAKRKDSGAWTLDPLIVPRCSVSIAEFLTGGGGTNTIIIEEPTY